jgi:hypothetical protein
MISQPKSVLFPASDLDAVERGVLWPVVYASIFDAPVRDSGLWSQVVGVKATEAEIRAALAKPALRSLLVHADGLVWLKRPDLPSLQSEFARRERATRELLQRHHAVLDFVRSLKGVRFAALSGGCAHDAADDGDIDVFAVTEEGCLWRTLLWSTLVAKARGWRRVLCLNYLVDTTALALPWRDFYGAFELTHLKPIAGDAAFQDLLAANPWAEPMFPNFFHSRVHGQNSQTTSSPAFLGRLIEATARMIHRPYLRHRLPRGTGVELSNHVIRLHATDHRSRLRGLFQDALRNIGMEAPPWI